MTRVLALMTTLLVTACAGNRDRLNWASQPGGYAEWEKQKEAADEHQFFYGSWNAKPDAEDRSFYHNFFFGQ